MGIAKTLLGLILAFTVMVPSAALSPVAEGPQAPQEQAPGPSEVVEPAAPEQTALPADETEQDTGVIEQAPDPVTEDVPALEDAFASEPAPEPQPVEDEVSSDVPEEAATPAEVTLKNLTLTYGEEKDLPWDILGGRVPLAVAYHGVSIVNDDGTLSSLGLLDGHTFINPYDNKIVDLDWFVSYNNATHKLAATRSTEDFIGTEGVTPLTIRIEMAFTFDPSDQAGDVILSIFTEKYRVTVPGSDAAWPVIPADVNAQDYVGQDAVFADFLNANYAVANYGGGRTYTTEPFFARPPYTLAGVFQGAPLVLANTEVSDGSLPFTWGTLVDSANYKLVGSNGEILSGTVVRIPSATPQPTQAADPETAGDTDETSDPSTLTEDAIADWNSHRTNAARLLAGSGAVSPLAGSIESYSTLRIEIQGIESLYTTVTIDSSTIISLYDSSTNPHQSVAANIDLTDVFGLYVVTVDFDEGVWLVDDLVLKLDDGVNRESYNLLNTGLIIDHSFLPNTTLVVDNTPPVVNVSYIIDGTPSPNIGPNVIGPVNIVVTVTEANFELIQQNQVVAALYLSSDFSTPIKTLQLSEMGQAQGTLANTWEGSILVDLQNLPGYSYVITADPTDPSVNFKDTAENAAVTFLTQQFIVDSISTPVFDNSETLVFSEEFSILPPPSPVTAITYSKVVVGTYNATALLNGSYFNIPALASSSLGSMVFPATYLSISPSLDSITAIKPTDGVYYDSLGNPLDFYIFVRVDMMDGSYGTYTIKIEKAKIYLDNGSAGLIPFGYNISDFANTDSDFLKTHILFDGQDGAGTLDKIDLNSFIYNIPSASNFPSGTNSIFDLLTPSPTSGNLLALDTSSNLDPFTGEPIYRPNDRPTFGWDASIEANYSDYLEFAEPDSNFSCEFAVDTMAIADQVLLVSSVVGNSAVPARFESDDGVNGNIWVRSVQASLSQANCDISSGAIKADGSFFDVPQSPLIVSSGNVNDYFVKSTSFLDGDRAYRLNPVRVDPDAPHLDAIAYDTAFQSTTDGWYYFGPYDSSINPTLPTITLTLDDVPASALGLFSAETMSGVTRAQVNYQGVPYAEGTVTSSDGVATFSFPLSQTSTPMSLSDFEVVIYDFAGNVTTTNFAAFYEANPDLDAVEGILVDSSAPIIDVQITGGVPQNGSYYNVPRQAVITVTEASFALLRAASPVPTVAVLTTDGSSTPISASAFTQDSRDPLIWRYTIDFEADGDYALSASLTDIVGLTASVPSESFTIDLTSPMILVTFDNNDSQGVGYFNAPRTATVEVAEHNFSADLVSAAVNAANSANAAADAPGIGGWASTSEDEQSASIYFGDELHYSFEIGCTDLAGNVAEVYSEPEFIVDVTRPTITVEFLENTQAFAAEVTPRVTFEDTNFDDYAARVTITDTAGETVYRFDYDENYATTTKVVTFSDLEHVLENDGVYFMHSAISDRAGNEAEDLRVFSVNRFGSTYWFPKTTTSLLGAYLKVPRDVTVIEINPSGLDEPETRLRLSYNDTVRTLAAGDDYSIEANASDTLWLEYTYTVPAANFTEDGFYRVLLRSIDRAENLSENTMQAKNADRTSDAEVAFALDTTAPRGTFLNVTAGTLYYASAYEGQLVFEDNIALQSAELLLNGVRIATFDDPQNSARTPQPFAIPGSNTPQQLELVLVDKAGNRATVEVGEVLITNDWFFIWLNTPWMFFSSIAAGIFLLGLIILIIWLIRRYLKNRRHIVFTE